MQQSHESLSWCYIPQVGKWRTAQIKLLLRINYERWIIQDIQRLVGVWSGHWARQKLFHPEESDNAAHMLYLAKQFFCSIFTHRCSRCLWARWLVFWATDTLHEGLEDSCQEPASDAMFHTWRQQQLRRKQWKPSSVSLNSIELPTFPTSRDEDESDSEAVSVSYTTSERLQWDISKRVPQCSTTAHRTRTSLVWLFRDLSAN